MNNFRHLPMSQESRMRFARLLDSARHSGIDPDAVIAAGPVALRALLALEKATTSSHPSAREEYLAQVQDSLRILEHRENPVLIQQFQARVLSLQGRGSDTEVAHVARGEIVVPVQLQNSEVLSAIERAAASYEVPLAMLQVGAALNSINPQTGVPEFGVFDWISGLFSTSKATPNTEAEEEISAKYDAVNFDPEGPGEIRSALRHPLAAFKALGIRDGSSKSAIENFERDSLVNGVGDAYRHALASSRLTNAVGPEIAKKFTDAHERSFPNSAAERLMDLTNNQIGRSFASGDDEADRERILRSARAGQLKALR